MEENIFRFSRPNQFYLTCWVWLLRANWCAQGSNILPRWMLPFTSMDLARKNGQWRMAHSLQADTGKMLKDPTEIHQRSVEYYRDLYRTEYIEPEVELSFLEVLPQMGDEHNGGLNAPLSSEEVTVALQGLGDGNASGVDGLPAEFYKAFWPVLNKHSLCPEKKGDLQDIKY